MSYDIDITKTPPAREPERQYYYMAKAKDFVEKTLLQYDVTIDDDYKSRVQEIR